MKVARVEYAGRCAPAVIAGSDARVIGPWTEAPALASGFDLTSLSMHELKARSAGSTTSIPLGDVAFGAPIGPQAKVICVGLNYQSHAEETQGKVGIVPSMFMKTRDALVGQGEALCRPKASECFDYEGEVAVVIGKPGRHIAQADAMEHVFGYTIMMDGSVRDYLMPTAGKNFWRSGALGPWIVTADEIPDPRQLRIETRLSGRVVQQGTAAEMIFSIPTIIEYISRWTPLAPGDVIATGTPAGIGASRTPPLWMKAGDVIEVEVSGVGTLRNPVRDE